MIESLLSGVFFGIGLFLAVWTILFCYEVLQHMGVDLEPEEVAKRLTAAGRRLKKMLR